MELHKEEIYKTMNENSIPIDKINTDDIYYLCTIKIDWIYEEILLIAYIHALIQSPHNKEFQTYIYILFDLLKYKFKKYYNWYESHPKYGFTYIDYILNMKEIKNIVPNQQNPIMYLLYNYVLYSTKLSVNHEKIYFHTLLKPFSKENITIIEQYLNNYDIDVSYDALSQEFINTTLLSKKRKRNSYY